MSSDDAHKALNCMATAAQTIREAIAVSMPVAPTQLLTMQIPGLNIEYEKYLWDKDKHPFTPLDVRINEARLVDNMVPVAKMMMGRTGKSVARSYLAALDLLIPVEASVSGAIALNKEKQVEPRLQTIRTRYHKSMTFLKSGDEDKPGQSKMTTYVDKQEKWNKAMEQYAIAQERQLAIAKTEGKDMEEKRQLYLDWIQAHARDYKAMIQARYMDWVVHGYKFEVEFNFGVVDISSGMKRVEASKEAFRNLALIDADGASEYYGVKLDPPGWARKVKEVYDTWGTGNQSRSPLDIRLEIKRLKKLLISHEAMYRSVDKDQFLPITDGAAGDGADESLRLAYVNAYKAMDSLNNKRMTTTPKNINDNEKTDATDAVKVNKPNDDTTKPVVNVSVSDDAEANKSDAAAAAGTEDEAKKHADAMFDDLRKAQQDWTEKSLESKKQANRDNAAKTKEDTKNYLQLRIEDLKKEISGLESELVVASGVPGRTLPPNVIDADGQKIDQADLKASKQEPEGATPSSWTRITAKVSANTKDDEKVTSDSANSFAAQASWGLWSASGGASHTKASTQAMSKMSSLDVEIAFDAMLVEIERPWLHAELFSDHELDCAEGFALSPGPKDLLELVAQNKDVKPEHTHFCSYPTAFIVAANVQLEFSGDTSSLESSLESSGTEANVKVGFGPFSLAASHKSSKSKSKTKTEATATGMRISLQAPQIISWISELLPELPKPHNSSKMFGLSLQEKQIKK